MLKSKSFLQALVHKLQAFFKFLNNVETLKSSQMCSTLFLKGFNMHTHYFLHSEPSPSYIQSTASKLMHKKISLLATLRVCAQPRYHTPFKLWTCEEVFFPLKHATQICKHATEECKHACAHSQTYTPNKHASTLSQPYTPSNNAWTKKVRGKKWQELRSLKALSLSPLQMKMRRRGRGAGRSFLFLGFPFPPPRGFPPFATAGIGWDGMGCGWEWLWSGMWVMGGDGGLIWSTTTCTNMTFSKIRVCMIIIHMSTILFDWNNIYFNYRIFEHSRCLFDSIFIYLIVYLTISRLFLMINMFFIT